MVGTCNNVLYQVQYLYLRETRTLVPYRTSTPTRYTVLATGCEVWDRDVHMLVPSPSHEAPT